MRMSHSVVIRKKPPSKRPSKSSSVLDENFVVVTGIQDTYTALLYELAFTATRSVSGQYWKLSNGVLG